MTDKIDMSLDDIIKMDGIGRGKRGNPKGFAARPNRENVGPVRSAGLNRPRAASRPQPYSRASKTDKWQHDMFEGNPRERSAHLIVANLFFGVTDADIEELFAELGTLRKAEIRYDRSGRSLGIADVIYEKKSDAISAMKQYNGIPLDGRPMKIQMANGSGVGASGVSSRPSSSQSFGSFKRPLGATGGRGRGRGIVRGAGRRLLGGAGPGKKSMTAEELDADLDAYVNKATLS